MRSNKKHWNKNKTIKRNMGCYSKRWYGPVVKKERRWANRPKGSNPLSPHQRGCGKVKRGMQKGKRKWHEAQTHGTIKKTKKQGKEMGTHRPLLFSKYFIFLPMFIHFHVHEQNFQKRQQHTNLNPKPLILTCTI